MRKKELAKQKEDVEQRLEKELAIKATKLKSLKLDSNTKVFDLVEHEIAEIFQRPGKVGNISKMNELIKRTTIDKEIDLEKVIQHASADKLTHILKHLSAQLDPEQFGKVHKSMIQAKNFNFATLDKMLDHNEKHTATHYLLTNNLSKAQAPNLFLNILQNSSNLNIGYLSENPIFQEQFRNKVNLHDIPNLNSNTIADLFLLNSNYLTNLGLEADKETYSHFLENINFSELSLDSLEPLYAKLEAINSETI